MRIAYSVALLLATITTCPGQHHFRARVMDSDTKEPLPGASAAVKGSAIGGVADGGGILEIRNIPDGVQMLEFSFVGYERQVLILTFPLTIATTHDILLKNAHEEMEEVIITSTRSSRTIADIPTRVEFIAGEELEEKANMKPGDIRMVLSESTGIQMQQTSATSANASIRIQGLDGRYTQILKDGLPLYSGFSGGLGLLQTPPLDLRQVEVIKGSSSTLYGGGAIAGMVNLISREPAEDRDLRFIINGTSAGGLDLSGFYSQRYEKLGLSVYASRNSNAPYDPAGIGLSAIPKFGRYTLNPKFFIDLGTNTKLNAGFNFTTEDRIGGDMKYLKGEGDAIHAYFEDNASDRFSTQFSLTHRFGENLSLTFKNCFNWFDRDIEIPDYRFDGRQVGSFTEINLMSTTEKREWIIGANLWTDDFSEQRFTDTPLRDYRQTTAGVFVQNSTNVTEKFVVESGLRGDYVIDYGFAVLPRLSLLYKVSQQVSTRLGGGLGYKAPTVFTEESERIQFQNVLPVSPEDNKLERSYGVNWDMNYRKEIGALGFTGNILLFYTNLNNPLTLTDTGDGNHKFVNLPGHIDSRGIETNLKLELGRFKLFIGYTLTDTKLHEGDSMVVNTLTAKHRLNNVLMYEVAEKWKLGLEGYYFSRQRLSDNAYGKAYWMCGFMAERIWTKFSVFVNFENFLDARQTRFDTIYTGTITNPVFRDIYAPVDGFVVNGGIKLKL